MSMASPVWRIGLFSVIFTLALSQWLQFAEAGIRELSIEGDSRSLIMLGQFGYKRNGQLEIEVSDVKFSYPKDVPLPSDYLTYMGFFLTTADDWVKVSLERERKTVKCVLQSNSVRKLFTLHELGSASRLSNFNFSSIEENRYTLMFANCLEEMGVPVTVSMKVRTSMYNWDGGSKDYLSEGQTQLPMLYFSFFLMYIVLEGVWIYLCMKQKPTAHWIHVLMGMLVLLKALYMFSEAEDKFYIKKTGTPHGWDVAFYAFSFLKGVMLFTVLVLIGTGWSFLKPYLQGKEKKVLMIVIPLQVLANIATVVTGETGPSNKNWFTWRQLLLLVDVICCCAVLLPIVWSIKHLREAAHTDGKAARNLVKLTLFRQYYIVVVSYIYFTRIVVFALGTITPYQYLWITELARELVTVAFYTLTGYKFRPLPHNPYFVLDEEEEEEAAEALKDDDFEL